MTSRDDVPDDWPEARVVHAPHPNPATDGETDVFIQWKGTDACLDFHCECGYDAHFDGLFAYKVECGGCGAWWEMPSTVYPRRCDGNEMQTAKVDADNEGWHRVVEEAE